MQQYIKKIGSDHNTTIISNDEMEDLIKIVKCLEYSRLLLDYYQLKNEVKEKKGGFLIRNITRIICY